jgi:hypothetical protein
VSGMLAAPGTSPTRLRHDATGTFVTCPCPRLATSATTTMETRRAPGHRWGGPGTSRQGSKEAASAHGPAHASTWQQVAVRGAAGWGRLKSYATNVRVRSPVECVEPACLRHAVTLAVVHVRALPRTNACVSSYHNNLAITTVRLSLL